MTKRERQYHRRKKIRFGCSSYTIPNYNNGKPFNLNEPSFGMIIPTDISRNVDGTPKIPKPEFLNLPPWIYADNVQLKRPPIKMG